MRVVESVRAAVRQALARQQPTRILVACSGGADSMCLLDALTDVVGDAIVEVCYVDHGLRVEAAREADVVRNSAGRYGIPFRVRAVDTPALMSQGHSVETAARVLRREALSMEAKAARADVIALGHTASDQAETVLMHMLRGSGLSGIAGMRERNEDLFRPLLSIERSATRAYCEALNIDYVDDPSNDDMTITRNRIRHEIFPVLEGIYPGTAESLRRLAASARRDIDFLETLSREFRDQVGDETILDPAIWRALPEAVGYHVLRMTRTDGGLPVTHAALNDAAQEKERAVGFRFDGQAEIIPLAEASATRPLTVPGRTAVNGLIFDAVVRDVDDKVVVEAELSGRYLAFLDHRACSELTVRAARPGDRIQPFGMAGTRKLKDVFIDMNVPRALRQQVPVIGSNDKILWIPGLLQSDVAKLTQSSRTAVQIGVRGDSGSRVGHCRLRKST